MLSRSLITSSLLGGLALATSPSFAQSKSSSIMNPDISLSVLTLYKHAKRQGLSKSEEGGGFSLQEAELQFQSDVDSYLRAFATFAVHPEEHEEGEEGEAAEDEEPALTPEAEEKHFAFEAEEAYLETTSLPYVTLKVGRFHTAMGRHNSLHTHAFPFIDAPLINQRLLGDHGLTETGASAALLAPLPWFLEATAQVVQGDSPTLYASESSTDTAAVYRLRNVWDLGDEATLDLGLSGTSGNNIYNERSRVSGADLSVKWRPVSGGRYHAFIFATEYMQGTIDGRTVDREQSGYAAWFQYQFAERWWAQIRNEEAKSEDEGAVAEKKISALIGFFPSEFSALRLQYDRLEDADEDHPLNTVMLQAHVLIGAHPAHSY